MNARRDYARWLQPTRLRLLVQWSLLAVCLILGVRFGLFVRHFETFGQTPAYARPPGIEGFLPIGALISLKNWLVNGVIDAVHPAALVLFVTFLLMALLAKNAFCSWLCPVGTLADGVWKLGRRLTGRTFQLWPWPDRLLRSAKYLLLAFFLKLIVIDMPAEAVQGFLAAPYWAVADVRMLHFFTAPSQLSLIILAVLMVFAWTTAPISGPEQMELMRDSKLMQMMPEDQWQAQYDAAMNPSPAKRMISALSAGFSRSRLRKRAMLATTARPVET